nr:MAG TPA: Protein of unknown function (DUF1642) [Caudoviricetes sp.]
MNNEKVYLKGYVVGHSADTLGYKGLQIQLENMDIVEVDENMVYKISDEPQKVTIPQDIADYIKYAKENDWDLQDAMDSDLIASEEDRKLSDWFYKDENMEILALAWINGYTVEKEKRYRVKIIGITDYNSYLNYRKGENKWTIESRIETDAIRTEHTRKELEEAGFGEVFNSPLFEVEEVE